MLLDVVFKIAVHGISTDIKAVSILRRKGMSLRSEVPGTFCVLLRVSEDYFEYDFDNLTT